MTVFRGILMSWPGRIFAVAVIGLMAGGAVFVSRANAPAAKVSKKNIEAAINAVLECFILEEILPCS